MVGFELVFRFIPEETEILMHKNWWRSKEKAIFVSSLSGTMGMWTQDKIQYNLLTLPEIESAARNPLFDIDAKRIFDVCLASIFLLLQLPLMVVIGILVKLDSTGPVIYKGRRVGRFGVPFLLYKFRTMVPGADRKGPLVTAGDDQRMTRLGKWLRRTKLDELPSLWNVLIGEMSWVGPRPENEQSASLYTKEQRAIWNLRPGITSLATIKYRNEEQLLAGVTNLEESYFQVMQDKLSLDLEYLRTRSFRLDMKIFIRTSIAIFE